MTQTITKFTCHGFRGYQTPGELRPAIPNGEYGSGLTVLIGPNGGGKSTIVEAFRKLIRRGETSFTEGKRNKLAGDRVSIRVEFNGQVGELRTVDAGGSEAKWISESNVQSPKVFFLPSRRVFDPYFGKGTWGREAYAQNTGDFVFRGQNINQFSHRLFNALKNKEKFQPIFERTFGKSLDWTIDQNDKGEYYIKVNKGSAFTHNSDGLGEGVVSLLFLVDAIFESSPNEILVIDEPELSLHPQLQRRLLHEICELARDRQIIYATHSPEMISIEAIINGMKVVRAVDEDDGCKLYTLDDECKGLFRSFETDLFNPHIFGYESKACLFAEDNIILTEGQEDVVFGRKMVTDLNCDHEIPFWGYGAGGSGKIEKIGRILHCLGFKKVGAIFDGNKADEAQSFTKRFPEYKCWVLPANDIRDKTDSKGKIIAKGIYGRHKKIKKQYLKRCRKMLDEIHAFVAIG